MKPSTTWICCSRSSSRIGPFQMHLDRRAGRGQFGGGLLGADADAGPVLVRRALGNHRQRQRPLPAARAAAAGRTAGGAVAPGPTTPGDPHERHDHAGHRASYLRALHVPSVLGCRRHQRRGRTIMTQACSPPPSHDRHATERRPLPPRIRAPARHRRHRRLPVDGVGLRHDGRAGRNPGRPVPSDVSPPLRADRRARVAGRPRDRARRADRDRGAAGARARPGRQRGAAAVDRGGAAHPGDGRPPQPAAVAAREAAVLRAHRALPGADPGPRRRADRQPRALRGRPRSRRPPPAPPRRSCSSSSCSTRCSSC